MSKPASNKNPDFVLYLNAKKYCPIIRLADSGLHQQLLPLDSAAPQKGMKVLLMVTPKKPVTTLEKMYSIFIPSSQKHISIDITHTQQDGKIYTSMCVRK